jgi:hypothetical protein
MSNFSQRYVKIFTIHIRKIYRRRRLTLVGNFTADVAVIKVDLGKYEFHTSLLIFEKNQYSVHGIIKSPGKDDS